MYLRKISLDLKIGPYLDEQDLSEKLKSELQWFELENKLLNLWEH